MATDKQIAQIVVALAKMNLVAQTNIAAIAKVLGKKLPDCTDEERKIVQDAVTAAEADIVTVQKMLDTFNEQLEKMK